MVLWGWLMRYCNLKQKNRKTEKQEKPVFRISKVQSCTTIDWLIIQYIAVKTTIIVCLVPLLFGWLAAIPARNGGWVGSVMSKTRGTIVSFFNGGKEPPNKKQKVAVKMSEPAVSDGESKQLSRSITCSTIRASNTHHFTPLMHL